MNFNVSLPSFRGPLDLLLYLVRKTEVEVSEVPLARIADQFLEHLERMAEVDVNAVGDFLEIASTLIEFKSRHILPRTDVHEGEEPLVEDPREDLVERLLEYKQYRDAATILEERSLQWQQHLARQARGAPPRRVGAADQPIEGAELWDLVSAMGRFTRREVQASDENIVYDDTPIHVYMAEIHRRLAERGQASFSEMFQIGMHKSALIGVFLAILELVRHHCVRTEQHGEHGEIMILPAEHFDPSRSFEYAAEEPLDENPEAPQQATSDGPGEFSPDAP